MSSCQGELTQTVFNVKAVDLKGDVIINSPIISLENGFIELWLPRERTIKLTIEGLNRSTTGVISTAIGSNTCITTFQLH